MWRFDVSIGLTVLTVPAHIPPAMAGQKVRMSVEAIDGVGWVSIAWCGNAPASLERLRLDKLGWATPRSCGPWDRLADRINAATLRALANDRIA